MTLLESIKQRCIEANPEIAAGVPCMCDRCPHKTHIIERPIRLADVLLAMKAAKSFRLYHVDVRGYFWYVENIMNSPIEVVPHAEWNLREDDLEKQSPETLEFIGKVLGV